MPEPDQQTVLVTESERVAVYGVVEDHSALNVHDRSGALWAGFDKVFVFGRKILGLLRSYAMYLDLKFF